MQHISQQHLPLLVQAILALLVADSSQHRNWKQKAGFRIASHDTAQTELELSGLGGGDQLGLPSLGKWGLLSIEL